jgi:hypothetical protein
MRQRVGLVRDNVREPERRVLPVFVRFRRGVVRERYRGETNHLERQRDRCVSGVRASRSRRAVELWSDPLVRVCVGDGLVCFPGIASSLMAFHETKMKLEIKIGVSEKELTRPGELAPSVPIDWLVTACLGEIVSAGISGDARRRF